MIRPIYPCLVAHPQGMLVRLIASYFAIDNRATYGHVCRFCWRAMSSDEQKLYSDKVD